MVSTSEHATPIIATTAKLGTFTHYRKALIHETTPKTLLLRKSDENLCAAAPLPLKGGERLRDHFQQCGFFGVDS